MGQIRIGLTISGAVSLGSFEGGALAALISGLQVLHPHSGNKAADVRIDAIGAASAGSITAVAAARILTSGQNPTEVMLKSWVSSDSVNALLQGAGIDAPFSMDGLTKTATEILNATGDLNKVQRGTDVTLDLALTNLRGLDYKITKLSGADIRASTYLDWGHFEFAPEDAVERFTQPPDKSPLDTALASGANEFGFPPKRLARTSDDFPGLDNFPGNAHFLWYTDGGTIDNEPLGRTMDLTNDIDSKTPMGSDDQRIHLLIHPFPASPPPSTSLVWADQKSKPTWARTLLRAFTISRSQNLYGDLRQAEKTNSRLVWSSSLEKAMDELIGSLSAKQKDRWAQRLQSLTDDIESDVKGMARHRTDGPTTPRDKVDGPLASQLFRKVYERASGFAGKNPVGIEVVSPFLAVGTADLALDQILAGEFLESFGGFFHEGLRRSDFALGFVCMLNWMSTGLKAYGLDPGQAEAAVEGALRAFYALPAWAELGGIAKSFTAYGLTDDLTHVAARLGLQAGDSWKPTDFGEMTLGQLPLVEQMQLANVATRILKVLSADVWLGATKANNN